MKIFVVIADLILCGLAIFTLIVDFDADNLIGMFAFFIFIIIILLNIYLINFKSDKSWLGLYLKRKALEEKNKIDKLTKE